MPEQSPTGRFVWYELMTTDPQAAQSFYTDVIGWTTAPFENAETPYTLWMNGEAPVGGVMELPPEARAHDTPPHWMAYVEVDDVDATAKKAGKLGGKLLVEPRDIPNVGRFAILQDPQGAAIAIHRSEQGMAGNGEPQVGQFSWHELATTDHEAAFDFYSKLFGWNETDAVDMGEMGTYQMYGQGDVPLGGMFNKTPEMPGPPSWLYYTRVDDIDRTVEKVREKGGQVLNGPMEVPGGDRIAQCLDPQGAMFAVHARADS
ncbi:MAG TPA: VOC family protein [Gemmatimonadota bacterium]|nr:VOC family protein [Gemmatimonadota bacterium]